MIIELPKEFSFKEEKTGEMAVVEDGILRMTRQTSFRKVMIEITFLTIYYQLVRNVTTKSII